MKTHDAVVDVFIIGAGPAGLTAALRLHQLGYRIQLIESSAQWPRFNIGEALTPGIKNIIEMLGATEALAAVNHLANIPTCVRWQNQNTEWITSGSAIVNRAQFDAALLAHAQQQGIDIARPASVQTITGAADDWTIALLHNGIHQTVKARFIVDASGRNGHQQVAYAERLSAMWTEIHNENIPRDIHNTTRVEALEQGWLWGSALPDNRYRVMWVGDPHSPRKYNAKQPEQWLAAQCATSHLFNSLAAIAPTQPLQACVATPGFAFDSWQDGRIKIGDAAFSLDPISSSGVEKAMRFSLTAAVAIHTQLSSNSAASKTLAQDFFQHRLIETCARHSYWTQTYYAQAWCHETDFWQLRSQPGRSAIGDQGNDETKKILLAALDQQLAHLANYNPTPLKPLTQFDVTRLLSFDNNTTFVNTHCVIDNQVKNQIALDHPSVERPLAYLEGEALLPHLNVLKQPQTLSALLGNLSCNMSIEKAQKITAWLWQRGIIASV